MGGLTARVAARRHYGHFACRWTAQSPVASREGRVFGRPRKRGALNAVRLIIFRGQGIEDGKTFAHNHRTIVESDSVYAGAVCRAVLAAFRARDKSCGKCGARTP